MSVSASNVVVMEGIEESSQLASFYVNANVLLTGGTGFIGKLLVQKLLRTCPDIAGIYLIIRQKKGKTAEQRLDEMFTSVMFDEMKRTTPHYRQLVHAVPGDIQSMDLGLRQDDRRLLIDIVDIVIHCGATVNMSGKLSDAVNCNVRSTRDLVNMAAEMKRLRCMMYVSTAYSNCNHLTIDEAFYKAPIQPETLIKLVDDVDNETLERMTPGLLGDWPNAYTYSKAVAEQLFKERMQQMPVGVFRPSIVIATYKDPLPHWMDNAYGQMSYMVATAMGFLHVISVDNELIQDDIPADIVTNALIAAIPDVARQYTEQVQRKNIIYNSVATVRNSVTSYDLITWTETHHDKPLANACYIPFYFITKCRVFELMLRACLHFPQALVMDGFLRLTGNKPRIFKLYRIIHKFLDSTRYFTLREFDIKNDNLMRVWNDLSEGDKQLFPFTMDGFDWKEFCRHMLSGLKEYYLKEKMDEASIQAARDRRRKLVWLHRVLLTIFYFGCACLLWCLYTAIFQ